MSYKVLEYLMEEEKLEYEFQESESDDVMYIGMTKGQVDLKSGEFGIQCFTADCPIKHPQITKRDEVMKVKFIDSN